MRLTAKAMGQWLRELTCRHEYSRWVGYHTAAGERRYICMKCGKVTDKIPER